MAVNGFHVPTAPSQLGIVSGEMKALERNPTGQTHQAAHNPEHAFAFAFGLDRLLDGIEALIGERGR